MLCGNRCAGEPNKPSGHSGVCSKYPSHTAHLTFTNSQDRIQLPDDFSGPYKDFRPPGNRDSAVGERIWGDVPYLPSYLDPMHSGQLYPSGHQDNLYTRGPFYKGASETHEEFFNHGGLSPRKFHDHVRHYEEPGMKHNKSITQTDFGPPHSVRRQSHEESRYTPKRKQLKNSHAKEYEPRSAEKSEIIFIDEEPKQDFSTETSDNYVCYLRAKEKNQLMDVKPAENEMFLERVRRTHEECPFGLPHEFFCDINKCGRKPFQLSDPCNKEKKPW